MSEQNNGEDIIIPEGATINDIMKIQMDQSMAMMNSLMNNFNNCLNGIDSKLTELQKRVEFLEEQTAKREKQ